MENEPTEELSQTEPSRKKLLVALGALVCLVLIFMGIALATGAFADNSAEAASEEESRQASSSSQSSRNTRNSTGAEKEEKDAEEQESDSTGDASSGGTAGAAASPQLNGGQSGGQGTPSVSAPVQETPAAPSLVTVSVTVDTSLMPGYPSYSGTVSIEPGSSVFAALCATGIPVGGSGSYVSSINGLAEFAGGPGSGWIYYVNGVYATAGSGNYALYGGENVVWRYTLNYGND